MNIMETSRIILNIIYSRLQKEYGIENMYVPALRKEAIQAMRREASRLREEYLEYAEDMEVYAKPEFWVAVEQVEEGKTRKLTMRQLREELKLYSKP